VTLSDSFIFRERPTSFRSQVNSSALTLEEKALILYRHCKNAQLDKKVVSFVRSNLWKILWDKNFTPLRIDRLVREELPKLSTSSELTPERLQVIVEDAMRRPTRPMQTSFMALDDERKLLLMSMLEADPGSVDVEELARHLERHLGKPPSRNVAELARSLDDHFLRRLSES
jgi:hypothetical protein